MKFDNKKNGKKNKRGVKKMAVMTQSDEAVFIIDENKVKDFNNERKEISSKMDYSLIIKQSIQIQHQIERSSKPKDEK